jgi:uncharacterized protein YmfQ (DUF2313 family)
MSITWEAAKFFAKGETDDERVWELSVCPDPVNAHMWHWYSFVKVASGNFPIRIEVDGCTQNVEDARRAAEWALKQSLRVFEAVNPSARSRD